MEKKAGRQGKFRFFSSISVKVSVMIILLVLPLNIVAIVLGYMAREAVIEQARLSVRNVMENYMAELESRMTNAAYLLSNMKTQDEEGIRMCSQDEGDRYEMAKIRFYHSFLESANRTNGADGYFFILEKTGDILVWDIQGIEGGRASVEAFLTEQMENSVSNGWRLKELCGFPAQSLFMRINNVVYGCWVDLEELGERFRENLQYGHVNISFVQEEQKDFVSGVVSISVYSEKADIWMVTELDRREVEGNISLVYPIMLWITFVGLCLIPLLYLLVSRLFIVPLGALVKAQRHLKNGEADYRIREKGNSLEFEEAFRSFNQMADRIHTLKIENYEKELDKRKMELKTLQLQIRPHFLLNTFNLIYTLAQRKETQEIQDTILYLSDYFRYIFRSNKELELYSKEQRLLEGYVKMALVRYPGCMEIEYQYDPEIAFVRVPPLLIHNFVENIVKHQVKQGRVIHISLVGQYGDKRVTFMIMDDGNGMTKEQVEQVDTIMRKGEFSGKHVGFTNSLKRLKYFYGETADITLNSDPGEGTCVTIDFPYNLEVEDESSDSE